MTDFKLRKIFRIASIITAFAVLAYLIFFFSEIILMLIISVLLAMILDPVVKPLENIGLRRTTAIIIIVSFISVILFFVLSYLFPVLSQQIETLSQSISQAKIKDLMVQIDKKIIHYIPFIKPGTIATRLENFTSSLFIDSIGEISNLISSLLSTVAIVVIIPFMTFFLLRDNKELKKGLLNIVPNKYFEMSYWVIMKISIQLGRFVRGWILDASLVGLLSSVGLSILGIENAIPIGIIAGLGHLIPYFGPIIGGIPAIIISVIQFGNFSMLPSIILLFLIIYTLDNGIIQPNVFSKSVDMHPLVIILLILSGSQLMGILGMLLAVPSATVIRTAVKEMYFAYKNYSIIRA
jgi:predicted PurR-regulated permease PerM